VGAFQDTLSGTLMRRLGEAADGYRTGEPVWIVADPDFPHEVLGAFPDSASADDAAAAPFEAFGPFRTETDFGRADEVFLSQCHMRTSVYCPDFDQLTVLGRDTISTIELLFVLVTGDTITLSFSPDSVDALFLTVSAVDHFLVPYYARLNGVDWAGSYRANLESRVQLVLPE
jgi:hypothetical protein